MRDDRYHYSVGTMVGKTGKHLFDSVLSLLPSATSVVSMVNETGVQAIIRAIIAMLQSQYVNLCWDATSSHPSYINEDHVNTDSGS